MVRQMLGAGRIATLLAMLCVGGLTHATLALAATGSNPKAEAFFKDAENYLKKGDANAAVIQLKNALQTDPNYTEARKLLGDIYLRTGNGPAAEKEFKVALQSSPSDTNLQIQLAKAYLLQGKHDAVLNEIKDDATDPKVRVEVLLVRARAEMGLGKLADANSVFVEAERIAPKDPRPKFGIAQLLANQGKTAEAEAKADEALAVDADDSDALMLKGELRRLNRDLNGAVAAFDRAIKSNQHNLQARLGRAAALVDLSRDTEAQAELQLIFQRVPRHPLASYLSALLQARKKDFIGAQEALQQAGAALDNHMPSVFLNGAINYALNQLEQAAAYLTRYVAAVPGNERARKLLGATFVRKGEPQRAIDVLKPLADSTTPDPQLLALLGSAHMRIGKFAEGTEYFEKAAEAAPDTASIRTQLALGRLALGRSDAAVSDLEAAMTIDADAHQAGILLALVRLRKGEFDEAIEAAQKLEKSMPKNPLPYNLLGAAYLGKGNVDEARKTFEEALKVKPDFHPARMNLAQVAFRQKKFDEAAQYYQAVVKDDPKHAGAMMGLADIAAAQQRGEEVVSWLQKAGDANPKSSAPKLRLIQYYTQTKEPQKALAVARQLDTSVPNNPQVLEALGRSEAAAGDRLAAVATFRRLVQVTPKSPRAYTLLATAQTASNDNAGARESYGKALELDPAQPTPYMALSELAAREGKYEEAFKHAATLREKQPKSGLGDMLTGDIHMRLKEYDKAIAAYDAGLKREDGANLIAIRRFNALRVAGKTDEALPWLQAWVDKRDDQTARHMLANGYIAVKNYDAAIRESELLIKKEPSNTVLLNNLAWLYDQKNDPRAVELAEKAYQQAPRAAAVVDTLGWILVRRGDKNRGADLLRQAHSLAPESGDIAYHLAVALKDTGKGQEAQGLLKRALERDAKFSEAEAARKLLQELGG